MKTSKRKLTVLKHFCKLIPGHLTGKLAKRHGVDKQSRTYSPWSHVVSLFYTQLSHALSLNDVCDALSNHSAALADIRGAVAPKRNTFSHANRTRNADMAEDLFWSIVKPRLTMDLADYSSILEKHPFLLAPKFGDAATGFVHG